MPIQITHIRGDDLIIDWTFYDDEGSVLDLTGSSIKYGISLERKRNPIITGVWQIQEDNSYKIHVNNELTSKLQEGAAFMDIQITDSNGIISTVQIVINVLLDIIQ